MLQLRVGIQLASLKQPFKKALHTAARLGVEGVEIDARGQLKPQDLSQTAVRQLRKMLEDLNLRVSAIRFQTRRGYNVLEDLDRRVEATKQAMRMAYSLGADLVINHVGRVPAETEDAEWTLLLQTLTDLGRFGQHVGALLAAQTGSETAADLAGLILNLPPGSLAVSLDPGNLLINGFSAQEAVEQLGAHVRQVYAKDGVRDLAQGRGLAVPLGRGSVDFPALLAGLEEHQYSGYVTLDPENSQEPIHELDQAVKYLHELFQ